MPWPPKQQRAIAARMARDGKSREQIREFFRKHGHTKTAKDLKGRR